MVNGDQTYQLLLINSLGLSVLTETLRSAAFFFTHSSWSLKSVSNSKGTYTYPNEKAREAKFSLAFVQGTGLEVLLDRFELAYDPDILRSEFFRYFHQRKSA